MGRHGSKPDLEAGFLNLWQLTRDEPWRKGLADPVREHEFAKVLGRKFRFDFAWLDCMVAVEIEGGTATGGRHTRTKGFQTDCEKYNLAAILGWRVLRYTSQNLKCQPVQVIVQVSTMLTMLSDGRACKGRT